MADGFRIPFQEAESEFVEKRSRFISHVWRVETEEEPGSRRRRRSITTHGTTAGAICWGRIWCATPTMESLRGRRDSPC